MTKTYSAIVAVSGKKLADALSLDLEALTPEPMGVGVFEVEDGSGLWEVCAYFTEPPDIAALAVLEAIHAAPSFAVSEIPEQDWVAKVRRDLPPVEAGRFFVYGAHDADKVPATSVPLRIEAAMAFGTGHHGTTLGCLRAFDRLLQDAVAPKTVADIGCGTAVLAMAAAKTLTAKVIASDIDPVAVDVAVANVQANGLEGQMDCIMAAGFDAEPLRQAAPYDLVFANILKGPLMALAQDMSEMMQDGGFAILSGILTTQAEEVLVHYQRFGFNQYARDEIVDWTTLTLRYSA